MKKGITFMALVIMFAIILTLTTTAVISGVSSINNAKKIKFATELSYVQEIMNSYNDVEYNINFDKSYSIDISTASQDVKEQFSTELLNNGKITLYYIDPNNSNFDVLKNSDLTYGMGEDQDDIYLYSIDTGKVYYKKGLELNGKLYYTLNDELSNKINYDSISEGTNRDIIFTRSTEDWTNTSVKCQLKIGKQYTKDTIKIFKDNVELGINTTQESLSYYVYDFDVDTNCTVKIQYNSTDGNTQFKTYNITNIDKIVPTIEVGDMIKLVESETGNLTKSIPITKKYDNESGIKVVKYEKTKINTDNIKSYFLNNGIVLNDDSINVSNNVEDVTIYIEDNAGNYNYINVK